MNSESLGIALYQTNNIEDPSKVVQLGYHTHNTIEFSYIHSGTIDFWYQGKDKEIKQTILKNQMIIIFPNVNHRFDINNSLISIGMELCLPNYESDIYSFLNQSSFIHEFLNDYSFSINNPFIIINDSENLFTSLLEMKRYSKFNDLTNIEKEKFQLKLKSLLLDIIQCEKISPTQKKSNFIINKSLGYIERNYFRDIKAPDVSVAVGVSYSYLRNLYQTTLHTSINDAINKSRIEKAKDLIKSGLPLKTVSEQVGFKTQQHFDKVFKKFEKTSPTDFKKNVKIDTNRYFVVNKPNLYDF